MGILNIVLITTGALFIIFGYRIYFKKHYNLINGFESDYKSGRKTESYARKVGITEFFIVAVLILIGIFLVIRTILANK